MITVPNNLTFVVKSGVKHDAAFVVTSNHTEPLFLRFAGSCGCTSFPNPEVALEPNQSKEVNFAVNRTSNYSGNVQIFKRNDRGIYDWFQNIPLNVTIK